MNKCCTEQSFTKVPKYLSILTYMSSNTQEDIVGTFTSNSQIYKNRQLASYNRKTSIFFLRFPTMRISHHQLFIFVKLLRCHSHAFVETLIVIITYFLRYVYYVTGDLFKKHVTIDIVNYSSIHICAESMHMYRQILLVK